MLRKCLTIAVIIAAIGDARGERYAIDRTHSSVQFSVRHIVAPTVGRFEAFSGLIDYDEEDAGTLAVTVTIYAPSINTGNKKRDEDLRSDHFFDAVRFPQITFTSERAEYVNDQLVVTGQLTMRGVTRSVSLPVEAVGPVRPEGHDKEVVGFIAVCKIKRSDFGIGGDGSVVIGDEVTISLAVEAVPAPDLKESFNLDRAVSTDIDPNVFDAYVGDYLFDGGMLISVSREEGGVYIQSLGKPRHQIFPESHTRFFLKVLDAEIQFLTDQERGGRAESLVLLQGGQEHIGRRSR